MLIGVTGSIGSGKSLVAGLLGDFLEAPVYSSDEICRRLLEKGEAGHEAFLKAGGSRFFDDTGEIDRVLLRSAVFEDDSLRLQLEQILHPLVRQTLRDAKHSSEPGSIQIAEVPLLFECGWRSDFDAVVCVVADREQALQRVKRRDVARREDVEKILDVQMDPALKASRSDWIIDNSSGIGETREQVRALVAAIRGLAGRN